MKNRNETRASAAREQRETATNETVSRRSFLEGATTLGAAGLFLGSIASAQSAVQGAGALMQTPQSLDTSQAQQRRNQARKVRKDAADLAFHVPVPNHPINGDEALYTDKIGSYSKGLPHNSFGEVDLAAYGAYSAALASGVPADFEAIPLGNPGGAGPVPPLSPVHKLINPQSGIAFDLEGTDSHQLSIPAAPAFASAWEAGEIVENYWMAHLRDVPYRQYASHALAAFAIAD